MHGTHKGPASDPMMKIYTLISENPLCNNSPHPEFHCLHIWLLFFVTLQSSVRKHHWADLRTHQHFNQTDRDHLSHCLVPGTFLQVPPYFATCWDLCISAGPGRWVTPMTLAKLPACPWSQLDGGWSLCHHGSWNTASCSDGQVHG